MQFLFDKSTTKSKQLQETIWRVHVANVDFLKEKKNEQLLGKFFAVHHKTSQTKTQKIATKFLRNWEAEKSRYSSPKGVD